jgi:cytosine/adenosine deaminase-related metal-dependent hydrolase
MHPRRPRRGHLADCSAWCFALSEYFDGPRHDSELRLLLRIARICSLSSASGKQAINLAGGVAAPGFVDARTHDVRLLLSGLEMEPKVSQGVTTVIGGNSRISLT